MWRFKQIFKRIKTFDIFNWKITQQKFQQKKLRTQFVSFKVLLNNINNNINNNIIKTDFLRIK